MATEPQIKELSTVVENLNAINEEKLMRRSLGEESLEKPLLPLLSQVRQKAEFAHQYAEVVSDQYVEHVRSHLGNIVDQCNAQADRSNQEYIAQKESFLNTVQGGLDNIQTQWAPFVTTAIEERGLLTDKGIQKEYEKTVSDMQEQSERTLAELEARSQEAIEKAQSLALEIEGRARRTAEKISVKEAQDQFRDAQKPLLWQLGIWGGLSIASIVAFFWLLNDFMAQELDPNWSWRIIYFTAIRLAALGAIGTLGAYCLRILRSQLHMFQRNLHRRRVANCIEAFVQSASTPEQRDFIYAQLVEAITQFGDTGLVEGGEKDNLGTKLTIDNITRSIVSPKSD